MREGEGEEAGAGVGQRAKGRIDERKVWRDRRLLRFVFRDFRRGYRCRDRLLARLVRLREVSWGVEELLAHFSSRWGQ